MKYRPAPRVDSLLRVAVCIAGAIMILAISQGLILGIL